MSGYRVGRRVLVTQSLAIELADRGFRVNAMVPGYVDEESGFVTSASLVVDGGRPTLLQDPS